MFTQIRVLFFSATVTTKKVVTAIAAELAARLSLPLRFHDFTLPAGDYQALRISIGSGSGQNWWCMMYPALCIPAAAEPEQKQDDRALLHGALPESACDIAEQPAKYEVRLKCVDALHAAVRLLREQLAEKPASPEQRSGHP